MNKTMQIMAFTTPSIRHMGMRSVVQEKVCFLNKNGAIKVLRIFTINSRKIK